MACTLLLGTAQLLKPWNKVGHRHPLFCYSALVFTRYFLLMAVTAENSALLSYDTISMQ